MRNVLNSMHTLSFRLVVAFTLWALLVPATIRAQEDAEALTKLEDMVRPTAEQLLEGPAQDWLVLTDDRVMVVEPVYPRPDTLKILAERRKSKDKKVRESGKEIQIFLPGNNEFPEYAVPAEKVQRIIYHEDHMLFRIDKFLDEGQIRSAYDMLMIVEKRMPNWERTKERFQRLLIREAQVKVEAGQMDAALVLLAELNGYNAEFPGLADELGKITTSKATAAFDKKDYGRTRHYVNLLADLQPNHPVVNEWRTKFRNVSNDFLAQADKAAADGDFSLAAANAKRAVDVYSRNLNKARRHLSRNQRFTVGVTRLAGEPTPYPMLPDAELRRDYLTAVNLFEASRRDDMVHYSSSFFEQWDPQDLGRKVQFSLRKSRFGWESQEALTAPVIIDAIADRVNPAHPEYDERLASFVQGFNVQTPYKFEVTFKRVPLRIEPLLEFPVAKIGNDGQRSIISKRFKIESFDENQVVYRRAIPEKSESGAFHVAEVVEKKFESHDRAMQALVRGEIDMLTRLHPWEVDSLSEDPRLVVLEYAIPTTHSIQFNPLSETVQNRDLRRALAYTIDRERILSRYVLKDPTMRYGRLVNAPYWRQCYATSPLVPQKEHDARVGLALTIAARKGLGGEIPKLKMAVSPDPTARVAAEGIVKDLARIGLKLEILPDNDTSGEWDLLYRTSRVQEPLFDLWPFLAIDNRARVESLRHLPDWLAQELVRLEHVNSFSANADQLHKLHRHLAAEGHFIPLWELDQFMAVRKNITGVPDEPLFSYQGIEQWQIKP